MSTNSISYYKTTKEPDIFTRIVGNKLYELNDHLGNVRATVSDRRLGENADLRSSVMYYPFGMPIANRTQSLNYRFGFNGKENDNEVNGNGRFQDYGFRSYMTDIARFASVDPLKGKYPGWTTYAFAQNSVIMGIDMDGLELMAVNPQSAAALNNYVNTVFQQSPKIAQLFQVQKQANGMYQPNLSLMTSARLEHLLMSTQSTLPNETKAVAWMMFRLYNSSDKLYYSIKNTGQSTYGNGDKYLSGIQLNATNIATLNSPALPGAWDISPKGDGSVQIITNVTDFATTVPYQNLNGQPAGNFAPTFLEQQGHELAEGLKECNPQGFDRREIPLQIEVATSTLATRQKPTVVRTGAGHLTGAMSRARATQYSPEKMTSLPTDQLGGIKK